MLQAATGTRLERKTEHSREKMSTGDPRDVWMSCALHIGLEKGFPSAQDWDALEEIQVSISCKAC